MNKELLWNLIDSNKMYEKDKEYWLDLFTQEIEFSNFYPDFRNNLISKDKIMIPVNNELTKTLCNLCRNSDMAVFSMFLASALYVIGRFTNNNNLLVGLPQLKNEQYADNINEILALKVQINTNDAIRQFLNNVKDKIKEAIEHSQYPVEKVLYEKRLISADNTGYDPYKIIIASKNIHKDIEQDKLNDQTLFSLIKDGEKLYIQITYDNNQYAKSSVKRWLYKILLILGQFADLYDKELSELCWLDNIEKEKLAYFNETYVKFPEDRVIHSYFEEQVQKTPEKCALIYGKQKFSYQEINEKSNQFVRKLISNLGREVLLFLWNVRKN